MLVCCLRVILTKTQSKKKAERLMEAVTENEPVIKAVIARGYDHHQVHVSASANSTRRRRASSR